MYRTGDLAPLRGRYNPGCGCEVVIGLAWGESFPRCPKCRLEVTWYFDRRIPPEAYESPPKPDSSPQGSGPRA